MTGFASLLEEARDMQQRHRLLRDETRRWCRLCAEDFPCRDRQFADRVVAHLEHAEQRDDAIRTHAEAVCNGLTGERPMKRYDICPHAEAILALLDPKDTDAS